MKESLLTILRDKNTTKDAFRIATRKLAGIMAAEAAIKIKQKTISVETTLATSPGFEVSQNVCLVPILRSGIALLYPFMYYFDNANIGFLGIRRNEKTFKPIFYYENLPSINENDIVIILDPMIATGGTSCLAIKKVIEEGAKESNIILTSIIAAPEGMQQIQEKHKDVSIYTVAIDEKLNQDKFIVPGLGDFGDRLFGTS